MSDREDMRVPTWCPVCERVMRSSKSTSTYYSWGCCVDCFIGFVEGREERWKEGWRPSVEAIASYYSF